MVRFLLGIVVGVIGFWLYLFLKYWNRRGFDRDAFGTDWVCSCCGDGNVDARPECVHCGAKRNKCVKIAFARGAALDWAAARLPELSEAGEEAELIVRADGSAFVVLEIRRKDGTIEHAPC